MMKTKKDIVISAKTLRKAIKHIKQNESRESPLPTYKGFSITSKQPTTPITTYYVRIPNLNRELYTLCVTEHIYTTLRETPLWHPMLTQEQKQKVYDIIHEAANLQIDKENSERASEDRKDTETITRFLNRIKVNDEKKICLRILVSGRGYHPS